MRGTKVGMLTQNEFDEISTNRMKYFRVIFDETREKKVHVASNTPEGFEQLSLVEKTTGKL